MERQISAQSMREQRRLLAERVSQTSAHRDQEAAEIEEGPVDGEQIAYFLQLII